MSQVTEQHGFKAHSDGAWNLKAPVQTRSDRFRSTNLADYPAVTGREVNWKFTPIEAIAHLLTGPLDGGEHPVEVQGTDAVSIAWADSDATQRGEAGIPEDQAAANAWGQTQRVLRVTLSGEEQATSLIKRTALTTAPTAAHTIIEAEAHSRNLLIMSNAGAANLTENVEIVVQDGAQLTLVTVLEWDDEAIHLAHHIATVGRDASLTHIVVSLGGKIIRVNPTIRLNSNGSNGEAYGAYFADAGQHLEHQVFMDHDAEHTRSRVLYKGALQGEGAHTVWIGDVLIRRHATGTDTYEANRNLVLSAGTRADSIPNLEIETGDIAGGGHASTTGRFDDEHIFYLQSRGISESEAKKLVVRGFLLEVIQQIGDRELEERLQGVIEAELERSVFA